MEWTRLLSRAASRSQHGGGIFGHHSLQGGESHGPEDACMGIDMATLVFHVVGMDDTGAVVLRKHLARGDWLTFLASVPPLRMGMDACGSAHDWARRVREHGHEVRLIAPQFIKAYVKSPKHDAHDAEAIGEAVTHPTRCVVPIKRAEPQDLQALHRVRARLIKACTALVHEIRGLLSESGMILPQRLTTCRALSVDQRHEAQATLSTLSAEVFWHLDDESRALEQRLADDDGPLAARGQAQRSWRPTQRITRRSPPRIMHIGCSSGVLCPMPSARPH
jgi:transposase